MATPAPQLLWLDSAAAVKLADEMRNPTGQGWDLCWSHAIPGHHLHVFTNGWGGWWTLSERLDSYSDAGRFSAWTRR